MVQVSYVGHSPSGRRSVRVLKVIRIRACNRVVPYILYNHCLNSHGVFMKVLKIYIKAVLVTRMTKIALGGRMYMC